MSSIVLIDTNIWLFALVKPIEEPFVEIHDLASNFLSSVLFDPSQRIAISCYQVSEVLEVLRRANLSVDSRLKLLEDFGKGKFFVKSLDFSAVMSAVSDSAKSNIHIYDYLVAYPLRGIINRIYSADEHFKHAHFSGIAEVSNPLSPWLITEGKRPARTAS